MSGLFLQGFFLGLSLILAIGAQNAFVLRQGLAREHVFAICLICALSDAALIAAGVAGFGWIVETSPAAVDALRWGGAVFLAVYGARALWSAVSGAGALRAASESAQSLGRAVTLCLAFTWLNPHVYLDTVVLVGAVAAGQDEGRWIFGAGAMTASFVFFFALGYGARMLAPVFARPLAWRILDGVIAIFMWGLAVTLMLG
jgi:L-lysine exporter family protein LysE/ArgO